MSPTTILSQRDVVYDRETASYAMELDGELVGFARTPGEAETTLDELMYQQLLCRPLSETEALAHELVAAHPGLSLSVHIPPALPLPSLEAIVESLIILAAHDDDPTIYADARQQLAAGVTIAATGEDRLINGVLVRHAPLMERWPWPWRCACGETRCWHGALLEGILLAWERLNDDPRPLPFEEAA